MLILATSFSDVLGDIGAKIFPSLSALITQLLATGVLFLIIRKYFWGAATEFVSQRKAYIESNLKDAEKAKENALKAERLANDQLDEAYLKARNIFQESQQKAQAEKDAILKSANDEAELKREQIKREVQAEKLKAEQEMKQQIIDVAMKAAEKVLRREISDQDNEKLVDEFIKGK